MLYVYKKKKLIYTRIFFFNEVKCNDNYKYILIIVHNSLVDVLHMWQ